MTSPTSTTAQGVDIDLSRFAELGNDVLPQLDAMREFAPLFWSETNRCWIVTGHDLVSEGFSGRLPLSAERHELIASFFPDPVERRRIDYLLRIFPRFVINLNTPEHGRIRKLVMVAFSKAMAERYRPLVRTHVAEALARLGNGSVVDFVDAVARPITARTILKVIGLPEALLPRFEYWAQTINGGLSGGNADRELIVRANDVLEEMRDAIEAEIARADSCDRDDILSQLLAASAEGDRLTRDEVIAQLIVIIIAGHDTTLNTMALCVEKLASLPDARDYLRRNPQAFDDWIMELMRVVAMSTSMVRVVAEDFEWRGKALRKGDFVFLMIAAANRDPAAFPQPDVVDFTRSQRENLTFGPGPHFCVGHWFARMMMSEALPAFLGRFERWDVLEERLQFGVATGFRGPVRLMLRLHAPADGKA